jgi:hypothetical protein
VSNEPVPVSKETLLALLDDIRHHVEHDDSFEGSLEYLMPIPEPCPECQYKPMGTLPPCVTCGGTQEIPYTDDTDFLLRAAYRIGNSQGQGGMRLIGKSR